METRAFLDRVLPPSGGTFFGASVDANDRFRHSKFDSIDELSTYIAAANKKRHNVYFATGVYGNKRESDEAKLKKALYVDIDCGQGKPYQSKKEAGKALIAFCKEAGFPAPSIIVDSGNGVHGYWTFDQPIAASEWQPMADNLKVLCGTYGLQIDAAVTADAARILRVPNTVNYKNTNNPKPVKVLHWSEDDYPVDTLRAHLSAAPPARASRLAERLGTDNVDDLAGGLYEADDRPRYAERVIKNCPVLSHLKTTGGADQRETEWALVNNLLAFTVDGDHYIHQLSDQHVGYTYNSTERKFKYAKQRKEAGKTGPTKCDTFAMYYPERCKTCKWRGHITTPLQLGAEHENDLPLGYRQDKKGIYKAKKKDADGESVIEWRRITHFHINKFKAQHDRDANGSGELWVYFEYEMSGDVQTATFPISATNDSRSFSKELSRCGIVLQDEDQLEFKRLMKAWLQKMQHAKLVDARMGQLGWHKRGDEFGFVTADRVYWEDGTDEAIVVTDRRMGRLYSPAGKREEWVKIAQAVTAQGRNSINAAVATAFGAPLIRFTGVSGAMFTIVSRESGTGKTSALRIGQSVWGDPRRGMHALDDTPKSVAHKLGFINNLPAYWDEIRMSREVENFVKLMFQLGQGKERTRLTQTIEMQSVGTWQTLIVAASNESIIDHVDRLVEASNAGRMRIFEVTVEPMPIHHKTMTRELAVLDDNYGMVGNEYAQWLVKNRAKVETFVTNAIVKFSEALRASPEERFWLATIVAIYCGAVFANKLGYTEINLERLRNWLVKQFKTMRDDAAEVHEPLNQRAMRAVLEYAASIRDQLVVTERLSRKGTPFGVRMIEPMRGEPLGCLGHKDKALRIYRSKFNRWVSTELRDSPSQIVKALEAMGAISKTRGNITCGIANAVDPKTRTYDIDLKDDDFEDMTTMLGVD